MNRQPYESPDRWWAPQLNPLVVRLMRPVRRRILRRGQGIVELQTAGVENLQAALAGSSGVLITPNHSFHYDSYVLMQASDEVNRPFHFMTAWQVFAMSRWFDRWLLQKHGCFSVDRESSDLRAFRAGVEILQAGEPLVVFPEGDVYHTNDRVTPFRDGAAALALTAAKRSERRIVCVPCALKTWYLDDPRPGMMDLMRQLEESLHWRPRPDLPLVERVMRFAEGMLALKEIEYLREPREGSVPQRVRYLAETILAGLEQARGMPVGAHHIPERVKELRRRAIKDREQPDLTPEVQERLDHEFEDLFFVIQLYSYPGDYAAERPTVERLAETLDKFEEDVFRAVYPSFRGRRRAMVRFGTPIEVTRNGEQRRSAAELTDLLEAQVQVLLNECSSEVEFAAAN
jgi:1-acyl-sn-glycerol-3-phosphate acyltransferase